MSNIFVERHDDKYVVIKNKRERAKTSTQAAAIAKAHRIDPDAAVLAERVRRRPGGKPDKWRSV